MNLAAYLKPLTGWKFWKEMITITVAMAIAAAAVYYFLMPGKLIVGSISGLSIVISGIFEKFLGMTVKVSVVVFIINAILLLLAWFLIGKEFGLKTAYAALVLAPLIEMWEKICPYEKLVEPGTTSVMGDIWFDLICFILILSASQAILFRINASTGGLDIIAKIVNKYLHYDMGMSVTIAGVLICCTAFAINPFRLVVIGLIGTWMNGLIVDYFMISLAKRKRVCIISEDYERIRDYIITPSSAAAVSTKSREAIQDARRWRFKVFSPRTNSSILWVGSGPMTSRLSLQPAMSVRSMVSGAKTKAKRRKSAAAGKVVHRVVDAERWRG